LVQRASGQPWEERFASLGVRNAAEPVTQESVERAGEGRLGAADPRELQADRGMVDWWAPPSLLKATPESVPTTMNWAPEYSE
jgi:hypothetical protein